MIPKSEKFITEFRSGSSLPLLVEADDFQQYVIKLHGSGEGKLSTLTGLIASRIAAMLGVKVLPELLIHFNSSIIPPGADPEITELAQRSNGINSATRFLPEAKPFNLDVNLLNQEERDLIFLTDLLLMNIDRTAKNPNILCSGGSVYCYDYSMSMAVRNFFGNTRGNEQNLLPLMKRHLFWRKDINPENFISRMKSVRSYEIQNIIEVIPIEWLREFPGPAFTDNLFRVITKSDLFLKNLDLIRQLPDETEEEIRKKNLSSRQAFMDKFGKI